MQKTVFIHIPTGCTPLALENGPLGASSGHWVRIVSYKLASCYDYELLLCLLISQTQSKHPIETQN